MKILSKLILSFFSLFLIAGCATVSKKEESKTEDQNTLIRSELTDTESFYLQTNESYELNAYEANLEDGFQTLTCTLYQLENHVWKNLEEVVFDLRSPTLEFALSAYLDTTMVSVQMNDEENKGSGHIDIKEFKVIPSGSENDELLKLSDTISKTAIENGKEFPASPV
ncbi:hypothetical protein QUW03_01235 [Faecalicoccus acidiformans]|uniref:hypothetical protein n=1 Tax=Faecalicoccus acidiformans TaxID=915173 RepID=UPI0025A44FE3|nr:hypothetical protein [Faecalicoccus acidiformans]MDM8202992.1 hypothetical protein [Faecalicoccus acidiformans]